MTIAFVPLALAFLAGIVRAALGPTLADRAVGADLCLFTVAAGLALLTVELGTTVFVDAILVTTLLGFVATASLARLLGRKQ